MQGKKKIKFDKRDIDIIKGLIDRKLEKFDTKKEIDEFNIQYKKELLELRNKLESVES